ncbi:MAG TPA: hypothetical protein VGA66_07225, partial [Mycobacterium sp.]
MRSTPPGDGDLPGVHAVIELVEPPLHAQAVPRIQPVVDDPLTDGPPDSEALLLSLSAQIEGIQRWHDLTPNNHPQSEPLTEDP